MAPIASASTKRPVGCLPSRNRAAAPARSRPEDAIAARMRSSMFGVSVEPAQIALQVTPLRAVSSATARVRPIRAVLVVT